MTANKKLLQWFRHNLILSIPFGFDFTGKTFCYIYADTLPDYILSATYATAIALTYISFQLLWLLCKDFAYRYKSEMLLWLILLFNNLIDAVCSFFPESGLSAFKLQWSEFIIGGIIFMGLFMIGYLKYRKWTHRNG
jgi:hypothetical protein